MVGACCGWVHACAYICCSPLYGTSNSAACCVMLQPIGYPRKDKTLVGQLSCVNSKAAWQKFPAKVHARGVNDHALHILLLHLRRRLAGCLQMLCHWDSSRRRGHGPSCVGAVGNDCGHRRMAAVQHSGCHHPAQLHRSFTFLDHTPVQGFCAGPLQVVPCRMSGALCDGPSLPSAKNPH